MASAAKLVSAQPDHQSRMYERHYSPAEIGVFENEPGVLVFENPARSSSRRFRTLRIPESVAQRVHSRFSNGGVGSRIRA
jgi:hypothetical protein